MIVLFMEEMDGSALLAQDGEPDSKILEVPTGDIVYMDEVNISAPCEDRGG